MRNIFDCKAFKGWNIELPLIQGGMGVGVSLGRLAGAVASEGAIGVISTAQIGFTEPDFFGNEEECNLRGIRKQIARAKEIAGGRGMVGVNIMVALQQYKEHVKEAVKAGADLIICGAGLPIDLPELVKGSLVKIAPIVSSKKAAAVILKAWDKKYHRTPDCIVVEGPQAGGHLGFKREDLDDIPAMHFDDEFRSIVAEKKSYEEKYNTSIPVFAAGGIWDSSDAEHVRDLGADGVQVATRFVATEECDASYAYKMAYVNAKAEDTAIIKSPVGMPGRALRNAFIKKTEQCREQVDRCYRCIKNCHPGQIPYCITKALVTAVLGDVDNGLVFCGSNVGRVNGISTVHDVIEDIMYEEEICLDAIA
ncbi:MAG: nitronate monooxygenase family protein [Clostridiales bacterium]|nr:nitronate monooxygenase family protein [Clostridiales bacterium]